MPPSVLTNMKRKVDQLLGDEAATYGVQRQSILDMSMCKLKMSTPKCVEPCLRRSVLILNTLKQIETELEIEGIYFPPPMDSPSPAAMTDSQMDTYTLPTTETPADENEPSIVSSSPSPSKFDSNGQVTAKCAAFFSHHHQNKLQQCHDPHNVHMVSDLVPCPYLPVDSSSSHLSKTLLKMLPDSPGGGGVISPALPHVGSSSVAFRNNTNEDLFSDLDLAMFDFDLASLSSAIKLTPLSAEEVLHSFPPPPASHHPSESLSCSSSLLAAPTILSESRSGCKSDALMDDLDNIMQILVGM